MNWPVIMMLMTDCIYSDENYDCEGNCISDIDCEGICGGVILWSLLWW